MVESKYFFLWWLYGGLLSSKKRQAVQKMLRRGSAGLKFMLIENIFYSCLEALLSGVCYSPQKIKFFTVFEIVLLRLLPSYGLVLIIMGGHEHRFVDD